MEVDSKPAIIFLVQTPAGRISTISSCVLCLAAVTICLLIELGGAQPTKSKGITSPTEVEVTERLSKLEAILPGVQKQLEDNSKQLIKIQKDLASLHTKMDLVI